VTGELATATFSLEGLARLKCGLQRAGLAASWFDGHRSMTGADRPTED